MSKVYTNIPGDHEWFKDVRTVFLGLDYPITLSYSSKIEKLVNTSNVYFVCNAPNGNQIVAACNSLFRALLSLSVAIEGEQEIKL